MKKILLLLLFTLSIYAGNLSVVTSIPDIAVMAEQIGGSRVRVTALATGREDLHAVPARPSFLPLLNRTDMVLTLGLDAEHAWLPALVKEARNPDIIPGQPGWVELNEGVTVLQVPQVLDRSEGEQHPDGNPHYNIGPHTGVIMARNILSALIRFDPAGEDIFRVNFADYEEKLKKEVESLRTRGASLVGKKLIAYHEDVAYLCEFYQMKQIGAIEVKPGVPPTASHLQRLQEQAKRAGADIIIHNQSQSNRIPHRLSRDLNIPVAQIGNAVGAREEITTWIELQNYNLDRLLEALGE
jgi:zinc/manganese transport system substrate-binding protein